MHEPETARGPSRSDMYQEYGSAGDASVEHDQQSSDDSSSLVTQMQTAAEQYVGQPPIPQMQSDDEKPDLRGASSFTEETRYAMQSHAKPDLAVSGQADRQEHATELVHEDIIRPDDAAELGQGADRLAYAEALERALATGAPLASESLGADMAHNSHLTKHTIQAPMLGLRSPCGQQVMCHGCAKAYTLRIHCHPGHWPCTGSCSKLGRTSLRLVYAGIAGTAS